MLSTFSFLMVDGGTIDFSHRDESRVTVLDRGSLHRALNAPQLFAIGYGDVGSSIYYALGVTTIFALGAVPLALGLAGIVFFCTVLTYTELSTAELYNFGAMLSFMLAHLSLLGLRIRQPEAERPFKVGWNLRLGRVRLPVTAIIGLLGTAAVWIDVIFTKPAGRNLGFVWMGAGVVSYLWYRRQQRLPATARVEIERLNIPGCQALAIKKILVPTSGGYAYDAVEFAAKLAKSYGAQVTALHVIEIPPTLPLDTFFRRSSPWPTPSWSMFKPSAGNLTR